MPKNKVENVEDYLKSFPKDIRAPLEELRKTIQKTAPEAEEVISYQLPAFRFHGMLIYYSAYKDHLSLSFPSIKVFEVLKKELSSYELGKTSIKFPIDKPLPLSLVKAIVKFRMKENLERDSKKEKKK